MFTFDTYAEKICRFAELKPRVYEAHSLNTVVLALPFAEAHAAYDGQPLDGLPRLGETVSLQQHMQEQFFDVIAAPSRGLYESTAPVLIKCSFLERLEGWAEWHALAAYLTRFDLQPLIVFKNAPLSAVGRESYYVADIRVICVRPEPYAWSGSRAVL